MSQLKEYECFIDAGIYGRDKPPDRHKKIRAHLVFDIKHDMTDAIKHATLQVDTLPTFPMQVSTLG
jgi:hypothetical protein